MYSTRWWFRVIAMTAFAATGIAFMFTASIAAPPEIAPIQSDLNRGRERLRIRQAGEERSRAVLSQATEAERLAIELQDAAALPVAREASNTAREALRSSQEGIATEEQRIRALSEKAREVCGLWTNQARSDRAAIERLNTTRELTQRELEEWSRMNADAQRESWLAVAEGFIGEYVADLDQVRERARTLHAAALERSGRVAEATTKARQLKELHRLDEAMTALKASQSEKLSKEWANSVIDVDKVWKLTQNTWDHEFRVAKRNNEALREVLSDPSFKDAFSGADDISPGAEVVRILMSEAAAEAGKFALGVEKYQAWAGPQVRASDFTIKMAYASTKSLVSMVRVLDANSVAGEESNAAKALQLQYQKSVSNVKRCREWGFI